MTTPQAPEANEYEEGRAYAPVDMAEVELPVEYEPLGEEVEGTAHVETVTVEDEPEGDSEHYVETDPEKIQAAVDAYLPKPIEGHGTEEWRMKATTQADLSKRPPFILSEVEIDHPNGPIVIGWDTCGRCHLHIRICQCADGPQQPGYVSRWRRQSDVEKLPTKLSAAEQARVDRAYNKAVVAADPDEVEQAVNEVLEEPLTPSGRKKRADAGVKRGPRKKGTADSVLEAAGDLSAAMSKES